MAIFRNFLNRNNEELPTIEPVYIEIPQREQPKQPALSEAIEGKIEEPEIAEVQQPMPKRNTFFEGYRENYDNGFTPQNWNNNPYKDWKYRLGEGLGTVGRFIDSPLGRGVIAAGLNKALGYDNSALEGLQAFAGRQNAVTTDKLYRNELKKYGYTDDDLAGIRGTITSDMFKNLSNNAYRNRKLTQDQAVKQMNYIRQLHANSQIDNETAKMAMMNVMQNLDTDAIEYNFQDSNQTKNTNSQIEYRNNRLEQYDKQLALIDKRIAQTGANSAERIALGKQRVELLKQKEQAKQEEKAEKERIKQEKSADLAEFNQILKGRDNGAKEYARNAYIKKYGEDPMKKLEMTY